MVNAAEATQERRLQDGRKSAADVEQVDVAQRTGREELGRVPHEVVGIDVHFLDEAPVETGPRRIAPEWRSPFLLVLRAKRLIARRAIRAEFTAVEPTRSITCRGVLRVPVARVRPEPE